MKIKVKSLYHLLLISAVIGPALSYSKLYLFHVIFVVSLFSYLYVSNGKMNNIKQPTFYHTFFIVMLVWYAITLLWSSNKSYTVIYLGYILLGGILAISIIYYSRNLERLDGLVHTLGGVFCFDILIGLLEVLTKFRWPISPYSPYVSMFGRSIGYDPNLPGSTLNYLFSLPTGFHWNPNNFATVMNILLPFFLFNPKKPIKIFGSILVIGLIIASTSRANIIAMIIILGLYFIIYNKKRCMISIYILVSVLCVGSLVVINLPKTVETSILNQHIVSEPLNLIDDVKLFLSEKQSKPTFSSIGTRQLLIIKGINSIKETNGLGLGGGQSRILKVGNIENMHFFWMEIVVDAGIFFAALFFIWYLSMIVVLYRISFICNKPQIKYYASAASLALIGFIFGAISASTTIYMLPMWILFGFSIATINVYMCCRSDDRLSVMS
jgi:teichuronic acid biosynthesis protein TuaE